VNVQQLENTLNTKINEAKGKDLYFYIGVAIKHGTTPIQSLCNRQGEKNIKQTATGCRISDHNADSKAGELGTTLSEVYFSNGIIPQDVVCDIERSLIDLHRDHDLCLNQRAGHDCCFQSEEGIVYLRIYK